MKNRKHRTDSTSSALERFRQLTKDLRPPEHAILHDGAESFYTHIVECRSPEMWNVVDLSRAVELANTQLAIQKEKQELLKEGSVVMSANGAPMQNPRIGVVSMYARLEIAMAKQLQTDAINTQGRNVEVKKRNKAHGETLGVADDLKGDPFLAGMH